MFVMFLLSAHGRRPESIIEVSPSPLPSCLSQSLPKSPNSYGSSSLEDWALKQLMRVWGAILSNGEHSQIVVMRDPNTKCSRSFGFVTYATVGGGCGQECKATQGGRKSCGTRGPSQEKILKDLVPTKLWKRFLLVALKRTLKNITWGVILNGMGKLKWLKSWLTEAVAKREALLL